MSSAHLKLAPVVVHVFSSLFLVVVGVSAHAAGNVKDGREKARMCETCHGLDGRARVPGTPHLAGQVESYLVEQLKAFKSGERKHEQMSVVAQALSPQDVDNLAAYYSAIDVAIGRIPGQ